MNDKVHTIKKDQTSTLVVHTDFDTWNILASTTITPEEGPAVRAVADAHGNVLNIDGDLEGGILDQGAQNTFNIGADAEINGVDGVTLNGSNGAVVNAGAIHASATGILSNVNAVTNSGNIDGATGVDIDHARLINESGGHIEGTDVGVALDYARLTNRGTISSDGTAVSIEEKSTISNTGTIDGDIQVLDGGRVHVVSLHGTINGTIFGNSDGDTYETNQSGLKIVESADAGKGPDTVYASVDFTLPENIEILHLVYAADVNGHGNGSDNYVYGNKGENHLFGKAGADYVDGGTGDDMLTGGVGEDTFVFAKGTGHDTLTDYVDEVDIIRTDGFRSTFADWESHMSQHGNDVWIDFNKHDRLIIEDTKLKQIEASDFDMHL